MWSVGSGGHLAFLHQPGVQDLQDLEVGRGGRGLCERPGRSALRPEGHAAGVEEPMGLADGVQVVATVVGARLAVRRCRSNERTSGTAAFASMNRNGKQGKWSPSGTRPAEPVPSGTRPAEPAPNSRLTSVSAGQRLCGGRDRV
jgi:hypothetical protein